jgi:NDP-sugar pyrophosphorylase family protein
MLKENSVLNIVIPMAGRGSRFSAAGYELPKPLIEIHGQPMIRYVVNNLKPTQLHRFIFICLSEHIKKYRIDQLLREWEPNCEIIIVDSVTEGAACTVLLSEKFINNDAGLMIANSDQWVNFDIDDYLKMIDVNELSGLIMMLV